jgi:deferrochelatase/peroxidase EfeB
MGAFFVPQMIQGNILRGFRLERAQHLVLKVVDAQRARAFLARSVTAPGTPPRIRSAEWDERHKKQVAINIGLTFAGLKALGVPREWLLTFPDEFQSGMAARAARLGDVGESAPRAWIVPPSTPDRVHVVLSIWSPNAAAESAARATVERELAGAFEVVHAFQGDWDFTRRAYDRDGSENHVAWFGYRDGLSQPRFEPTHADLRSAGCPPVDFDPLGTVLLGHPASVAGVSWRVPSPDELGQNGSFAAFRVLEQDTDAFDTLLGAIMSELPDPPGSQDREYAAALVCGRWRDGYPLALQSCLPRSPRDRGIVPGLIEGADPCRLEQLNRFDFADDPQGSTCPLGAHIRRAYPRSANIIPQGANATKRIVRRGIPYEYPQPDSRPSRGLLGMFICASLAAQFESLQADWLTLGLQDPRITGSTDPMLTGDSSSVFQAPGGHPIVTPPNLVTTRFGAYLFLPSLAAIEWIARLDGDQA